MSKDNELLKRLSGKLTAELSLPPDAVAWLTMLYHSSQFLDDVADNDPIDRDDLDACIWNLLVGMPGNAFFCEHAGKLLPLVASALLKWKAADTAERNGQADERSFVWRAGYYDVVMQVFMLCHGPAAAMENAHIVLSFYGENFADYKEEF